MRKLFLVSLLMLMVGVSQTAFALPYVPEIPDDQPLYFKFNNYEQISATGSIVAPSGNLEQSWGIIDTTSVAVGDLVALPSGVPPIDHQLFARGGGVWADIGFGSEEITGIFWGIEADTTNTTNEIAGTNGWLDLYFDTNDDFTNSYNPADRTADDQYTGATEGEFLARIAFLNGAIENGEPNTSLIGSVTPTPGGFSEGSADSFGGVVADVDGDGIPYEPLDDGAWSFFLDRNWFDSWLGPNTADIRFKNSYNPFSDWDGPTGVIGAISDDPARAFARPIPEPTTVLLVGIGLLGLAGVGRRMRKR
jgi:hypothetical protein